jgi:16S rRNA (cytosine967-C5)-methyltransferase
LRRAVAARKRLLGALDELDPALRFSHPDWLWKRWKKQFGEDDATTLLAWNNKPAPTFLRLNPLRPGEPPQDAEALEGHPGFFRIDGPVPTALLDAGHAYIQDPATTHAVDLLAPRPGETILDACAAPGGKAALLATAMQNQGQLLCTDLNEKRLPRLSENLGKLGIGISATVAFDWTTKAPAEWRRKFDAILLDVPCSNTGVLRRRVDARWRLEPAQITELARSQYQILHNALPCLKPGGRLVYSTCSLEEEENHLLIQSFLHDNPTLGLRETRQALPFRDHTDGAYAALLMGS